jgi:hypothetical protein
VMEFLAQFDWLTISTWFFIAFIAFGTAVTITGVGKPRPPISGGVAVLVTIFHIILMLTLLTWLEVI